MNISRWSVQRIAKHDLRLKIYKRLPGLLWFDRWRQFIFLSCFNTIRDIVSNEITLICAKLGADVVNSSKFTSRKTGWPRFLPTLYRLQVCNCTEHRRLCRFFFCTANGSSVSRTCTNRRDENNPLTHAAVVRLSYLSNGESIYNTSGTSGRSISTRYIRRTLIAFWHDLQCSSCIICQPTTLPISSTMSAVVLRADNVLGALKHDQTYDSVG